jgi:hypothetical protein
MKIRTILRAINRYAAIHVCLAVLFAFCWLIHHLAFRKMEMCDRQFAVMNDRTLRALALIDWVPCAYILGKFHGFTPLR